jgi:peptidoglycan LD-endopeptidase LytH
MPTEEGGSRGTFPVPSDHHMLRTTPPRIVLIAAALLVGALGAPLAAAQSPADGPSSTTTSSPPGSTSTSSPSVSTSTTAPSSTTTLLGGPPTSQLPPIPPTSVYVPPLPPELSDDPRLPYLVDPGPQDGIDVPAAQLPFDPGSVRVLPERVEAARRALDAAHADLRSLQDHRAELAAVVDALSGRVDQLDGDVRDAVREAAQARRELSDHAVTAYMVGPVEHQLALLRTTDFVDMGVARSYVEVVGANRERLVRRYEEKRRGLARSHAGLAVELGENESLLSTVEDEVVKGFLVVVAASQEVEAYEAGAHAYINGFVFPVAGEVEFIDSWGFPRMMGTPSAHWHQGTDVFAPAGTPLVASENGVLARVGTASLGGNKLWVVGDSGHEYYYAHLSSFAEVVADGRRVRAGEVIGYVGDTGNAKGTSPHLHFEIHPDGLGPANPFPLLKAAYGSRPVHRAVAPTTTTPAAPPTAPAGP